jgi:hypothetical protein
MRRHTLWVIGVSLGLIAAACSGDGGAVSTPTGESPSASAPPTSPTGSPAPVEPVTESDFNTATFTDPTAVDNAWHPLVPGTQLVYEGKVNDGKERLSHRVVFTVTDLTKTIEGVQTAVIWDRDFTGGELVEAEIAFFGQDDVGNIWLFGEYPEEYEEGKLVDAPTWIHGLAGAQAGVFMRADPQTETSDYAHGVSDEVGFTDRATVHSTGVENCVPYQCFEDVLVIDEYNPDEPGKHQLKYYAQGIGNIRVGWAGPKEKDKEVLFLVEVRQLDDAALAAAREAALALEASAYDVSPDMYGATPPMQTAG